MLGEMGMFIPVCFIYQANKNSYHFLKLFLYLYLENDFQQKQIALFPSEIRDSLSKQ